MLDELAAHARGLYRDAAQLHKNAAAYGKRRAVSYLAIPPGYLRADAGPVRWAAAHAPLDNPEQLAAAPGWTLHDLRHSALTHAAESGANTGTLMAYSGHASVASLARYTRVSPDALTRWQARRDPHRRR